MHTITSKLNNDAKEHQLDGGSSIFFVSLGEQNYDRQTRQKYWTNYDAALFAGTESLPYYRSVLVKGAVIEVSASGLQVDKYNAGNGEARTKLKMVDAKLGFAHSPGHQPGGNSYQQPAPQAAQQPAPQPGNGSDFDDDIPF